MPAQTLRLAKFLSRTFLCHARRAFCFKRSASIIHTYKRRDLFVSDRSTFKQTILSATFRQIDPSRILEWRSFRWKRMTHVPIFFLFISLFFLFLYRQIFFRYFLLRAFREAWAETRYGSFASFSTAETKVRPEVCPRKASSPRLRITIPKRKIRDSRKRITVTDRRASWSMSNNKTLINVVQSGRTVTSPPATRATRYRQHARILLTTSLWDCREALVEPSSYEHAITRIQMSPVSLFSVLLAVLFAILTEYRAQRKLTVNIFIRETVEQYIHHRP